MLAFAAAQGAHQVLVVHLARITRRDPRQTDDEQNGDELAHGLLIDFAATLDLGVTPRSSVSVDAAACPHRAQFNQPDLIKVALTRVGLLDATALKLAVHSAGARL